MPLGVGLKRRYFILDMHFDKNPLKSSISCRSESSNLSLVVGRLATINYLNIYNGDEYS